MSNERPNTNWNLGFALASLAMKIEERHPGARMIVEIKHERNVAIIISVISDGVVCTARDAFLIDLVERCKVDFVSDMVDRLCDDLDMAIAEKTDNFEE